jgi:hypothetical protein
MADTTSIRLVGDGAVTFTPDGLVEGNVEISIGSGWAPLCGDEDASALAYCDMNHDGLSSPCKTDSTDYCCDGSCTFCGPKEFCVQERGSYHSVCDPSAATSTCSNYFAACANVGFNEDGAAVACRQLGGDLGLDLVASSRVVPHSIAATCDAGAECGKCLQALSPSECPSEPNIADCNSVNIGDLCEGDGECGTNQDLNNCGSGGFDVYRREASSPPSSWGASAVWRENLDCDGTEVSLAGCAGESWESSPGCTEQAAVSCAFERSSCSSCSPGRYSQAGADGNVCSECPAGRYNSNVGSSTCASERAHEQAIV